MRARLLESVFPTDTNPQGTLFAGTLMGWMDKAAVFAAMRRTGTSVVTAAIRDISFQVPIRLGDMVELDARVVSIGRTSLVVEIEVNRERPMDGTRELCVIGHFVMVAMGPDRTPTPVPPGEMPADPVAAG